MLLLETLNFAVALLEKVLRVCFSRHGLDRMSGRLAGIEGADELKLSMPSPRKLSQDLMIKYLSQLNVGSHSSMSPNSKKKCPYTTLALV